MNKLRLLANLPLYVDKIPVYSPLLREIAEIGLEQYGILLAYCVIEKEGVIDSVKLEVKNNYDALIYVINSTEGIMDIILCGLYFFTKVNFQPKILNNDLIFIKEDIVLNRINYDSFINNIRFSNRLEVGNIEELDEFDKRVLEAEKKINEVLNKAIRKSQELAAKELMNVSGGMGGLMGGGQN